MTHFFKGILFVVFWLIWIATSPFVLIAMLAQYILMDCYPGKTEWEGWCAIGKDIQK